jgi:spore maturation protein CgeB
MDTHQVNRIKILYVGSKDGTSLDRANAFRRLGHVVEHVNLRELLPRTVWVDRATWQLGGALFGAVLIPRLRTKLKSGRFDLCHVDSGAWVTPQIVGLLREHTDRVINYSIDDPLGPRDGVRWKAYRQSLSYYDLCVVMREQNVAEARALGANKVLRVYMSADEITHAPRTITEADRRTWASDVLFVGTWFPERGPFLLDLIKQGIPLQIRGHKWNRAPEWSQLQSHWKGGNLGSEDYAKAIQCSKVSLGLLSKGNRDLHTTRSLEIPALGGLLCAERTSEHLQMYRENAEALYWSDAEECAAACRWALSDEVRRQEIAAAGHVRIAVNKNYNESVMSSILDSTFGVS